MTVPKMCFDRIVRQDAAEPRPLLTVPGLSDLSGPSGMTRAISPRGKTWLNDSTLRVRFMGGSDSERAVAREQALWWADYINLTFVFVPDGTPGAEIRVTFDGNDGAWSTIGTDATQVPGDYATMNLGFLDGGTAAHEFGHAIGLAHEHSSPAGGIEWNEPVVLADLAGPPNYWDEATVRHNVFYKYSFDQINGTAFDPDSIMLYAFPAEWTRNGVATHSNDVLSALDKEFVAGARMYPKPDIIPISPSWGTTLLTVDGAPVAADIGQPGEEDVFRFAVAQSGVYQIDTHGRTDLYMKLFGPSSRTNLLGEDDDSGYGLNARILRPLSAGEYYVQIRHYERSGAGKYTIGVKRRV